MRPMLDAAAILDRICNHPLFLGLIASLLTIGATAWLDSSRLETDAREAAIHDVDRAIALIARSRTTANLLGTALNNAESRSCQTVERLRISHEEAYVEWQARLSDHVAGIARYYDAGSDEQGVHCLMWGLLSQYAQNSDAHVMSAYDVWRRSQIAVGDRLSCTDASPAVDLGFVTWLQTCEEHVRSALYEAIEDQEPRSDLIDQVFDACNAPRPDTLFCG